MNINNIYCNKCHKTFYDFIPECNVCGTSLYLVEEKGELWIAHLSTANFDFYLIAENENVMWQKLEETWNNHAKKTNATYTWEDLKDSVWWNKQQINQTWKKG